MPFTAEDYKIIDEVIAEFELELLPLEVLMERQPEEPSQFKRRAKAACIIMNNFNRGSIHTKIDKVIDRAPMIDRFMIVIEQIISDPRLAQRLDKKKILDCARILTLYSNHTDQQRLGLTFKYAIDLMLDNDIETIKSNLELTDEDLSKLGLSQADLEALIEELRTNPSKFSVIDNFESLDLTAKNKKTVMVLKEKFTSYARKHQTRRVCKTLDLAEDLYKQCGINLSLLEREEIAIADKITHIEEVFSGLPAEDIKKQKRGLVEFLIFQGKAHRYRLINFDNPDRTSVEFKQNREVQKWMLFLARELATRFDYGIGISTAIQSLYWPCKDLKLYRLAIHHIEDAIEKLRKEPHPDYYNYCIYMEIYTDFYINYLPEVLQQSSVSSEDTIRELSRPYEYLQELWSVIKDSPDPTDKNTEDLVGSTVYFNIVLQCAAINLKLGKCHKDLGNDSEALRYFQNAKEYLAICNPDIPSSANVRRYSDGLKITHYDKYYSLSSELREACPDLYQILLKKYPAGSSADDYHAAMKHIVRRRDSGVDKEVVDIRNQQLAERFLSEAGQIKYERVRKNWQKVRKIFESLLPSMGSGMATGLAPKAWPELLAESHPSYDHVNRGVIRNRFNPRSFFTLEDLSQGGGSVKLDNRAVGGFLVKPITINGITKLVLAKEYEQYLQKGESEEAAARKCYCKTEYFTGKKGLEGYCAYVLTMAGELIVFPHISGMLQHSTAVAGGKVLSAGMVKVVDGVPQRVELRTGHYEIGRYGAQKILHYLAANGFDISGSKLKSERFIDCFDDQDEFRSFLDGLTLAIQESVRSSMPIVEGIDEYVASRIYIPEQQQTMDRLAKIKPDSLVMRSFDRRNPNIVYSYYSEREEVYKKRLLEIHKATGIPIDELDLGEVNPESYNDRPILKQALVELHSQIYTRLSEWYLCFRRDVADDSYIKRTQELFTIESEGINALQDVDDSSCGIVLRELKKNTSLTPKDFDRLKVLYSSTLDRFNGALYQDTRQLRELLLTALARECFKREAQKLVTQFQDLIIKSEVAASQEGTRQKNLSHMYSWDYLRRSHQNTAAAVDPDEPAAAAAASDSRASCRGG